MATDPATVEFILEQAAGAGPVSSRKMFGEYALYLDARVVALICDGQLFLKPTPGARDLFPEAAEGPPYPGAKPHLLGDALLDDPDRLAATLRAIAADLPDPKPKKPKARP